MSRGAGDDAPGEEVDVNCYFDFDRDDSIRIDWIEPAPRVTVAGKPVSIVNNAGRHVERIVASGGRVLFYSPDQHSDGSLVAGRIDPRETKRDGRDSAKTRIFDPRAVGLFPCLFMSNPKNFEFDAFVGRRDIERIGEAVSRDNLDGREVWRIEYNFKLNRGNSSVRLWIADGQGNSLLRAEQSIPVGEKILTDSIACTVLKHEPGDVWFPTTIVARRQLGDTVVASDETTISGANFNVGVDSSVFTFPALNPRVGTQVYDRTAGDRIKLEWDGTSLEPAAAPRPPAPLAQMQPRSRTWLLIGINCAVLAAILAALYLRARRAQKQK